MQSLVDCLHIRVFEAIYDQALPYVWDYVEIPDEMTLETVTTTYSILSA